MSKAGTDAMRELADEILKVDGDRDCLTPSRLTAGHTVIAAKAIQLCADEIDRLRGQAPKA